MGRLFGKLLKWILPVVAAVVITLALLVGVARLMLPQVPLYRAEIRNWVQNATGFELDFRHISAGLSFSGPELRLSEATISWPKDGVTVLRADQIDVSLNLWVFMTDGLLIPGRIAVSGSRVELERSLDGSFYIQGQPWSSFTSIGGADAFDFDQLPTIKVLVQDIEFSYQDLLSGAAPANCWVNRIQLVLEDGRVRLDGRVQPDPDFGRQLEISTDWPLELLTEAADATDLPEWKFYVAAEALDVDHWFTLWNDPDFPISSAKGDLSVWADFRGWQPSNITAELDLSALSLKQPNDLTELINRFEGLFEWQRTDAGWLLAANGLRLVRGDSAWPSSSFSVRYVDREPGTTKQISVQLSFLRLSDLMPFVRATIAEEILDELLPGEFQGDIEDATLQLELPVGQPLEFDARATFSDLGYTGMEPDQVLGGVSGSIVADQNGGQLQLDSFDVQFGLFNVFRAPVEVGRVSGLLVWRSSVGGHTILGNSVEVATSAASARATFELTLPRDSGVPVIDLTATATISDVSGVLDFLPRRLPPKVLSWLDRAVIAGEVPRANIVLRGPLLGFPYDHGEGVFRVVMPVRNGILDYAPEWPRLFDASGTVIFDGVSIEGRDLAGKLLEMRYQDGRAQISDVRKGIIEVSGQGQTAMDEALDFIRASPIGRALQPRIEDVTASGTMQSDVQLVLPIKSIADYQVIGRFELQQATLGLNGIEDKLTELVGVARLNNLEISAENLRGQLLDEPVRIQVRPMDVDAGDYSHVAWLNGTTPAQKTFTALGLPMSNYFSGDLKWRAAAFFPIRREETPVPFRLMIRTDIEQLASELPTPLNKIAGDPEIARVLIDFPQSGNIEIFGRLQRDITWAIGLLRLEEGWKIDRGAVHLGKAASSLPAEPGLELTGHLASARPADWFNLRGDDEQRRSRWRDIYREMIFHIDELFVFGQRFENVELQAQRGIEGWEIEIESKLAVGELMVPFEFGQGIPMKLDMDRLLLMDPDRSDSGITDPRTLPPIQAKIAEFAIGEVLFGALEASAVSVPQGLQTEKLEITGSSYSVTGAGEWLIIEDTPRSRLQLSLASTDVLDTLVTMGYEPLMEGEAGEVYADLSWEGSPGEGFLYRSTGEVRVSVKNGQLFEVEPGGGRLLGLVSVTALPRRLQLDFSDVLDEGLGFKRIRGDFRLDSGSAYTCNLGLEGPVADIGVVGRAGIRDEDYDQLAVVRPHMSNALAVPAFIVSPGLGAAMLLINRIFREPLSSIGESYFRVSGPWENPLVEPVQRADMDLTAFRDCEKVLPDITPDPSELTVELPEGLNHDVPQE